MRLSTLTAALSLALTTGSAFAANGDLDINFGSGGLRSVSFDLGGNKADSPNDLLQLSDGSFLAVGHANTAAGPSDAVAVKVSNNGVIDFGFANLGKLRLLTTQAQNQDEYQSFYAGVPIAGGGAVLVGTQQVSYGSNPVIKGYQGLLAKVSSNGTVVDQDGSYGTAQLNTDFSGAAIDPQGRVVCSGAATPSNNGSDGDFYARLYDTNSGTYYQNFALSGDSFVPFTLSLPTALDVSTAAIFMPDGSILQGGYTQVSNTDYDFGLARLSITGDLIDQATYAFDLPGSSKNDRLYAIKMDSQGRLLLAGNVSQAADPTVHSIGLIRLKPNLALDNTFGTNGKLVLSFDILDPNANDSFGGIAIADDGKILVVGTHYTGNPANVSDVALVRLKDDGNADLTFGVFGREFYDFGLGATHADYGVDVEVQGNRAVVLSQREYNGADTDFLLFGVVSNQNPKPDAVFKNSFE